VRDALRKGIHDAGARSVALDEQPMLRAGLNEVIQYEMARADCVIADVTTGNPNVFFEIGVAQALGKRVILCINRQSRIQTPSDLQGYFILDYTADRAGLAELSTKLTDALRGLRRLPRRARLMQPARYSAPFSVDWDQLETAEAENLCRELLAQLGYQRVDWTKESGDWFDCRTAKKGS